MTPLPTRVAAIVRARALVVACGAAAILAATATGALAAEWPEKPIRLIVSFAPGGPMDALARIVSARIGPALGQSIVVENKVGAAGNIGLDYVAKAAPDGYVVGLMGATAVTASITAKGQAVDPLTALTPVARLVQQPLLIASAPTLPARSLPELVAVARREPGKLSYSTQGIGTPPHVAGLLLLERAGITLQHIPYSGTAQTYKDVITGEVPLTISFVNLLKPFVQSGQLRALAVTSTQRAATLPDVPTVAESGYPGYVVDSWLGLMAPAQTPPAVVERLGAELLRMLQLPDVREQLLALGMEPAPAGPQQFALELRADVARWEPLLKSLARAAAQ